MKKFLVFAIALYRIGSAFAQANADGSYTIPIYVNPDSFGPDRYTIYAAVGGGAVQPYLFDTGSPNLFTTASGGNFTGTTGSFSFAQGITYDYNVQNVAIALGNSAQQTIVSTGPINVAQVTQIDGNTITPNEKLQDNTYGDFGAGGYGSNTLATVLTQVDTGSLKEGYAVNVAGVTSGAGSLTLGISDALHDAFFNNPNAIILDLSDSGVDIPTADGTIPGFNKAQAGGTTVTMTKGADSASAQIGTVFDTGGGPNSIVYSGGFDNLGGGVLTIDSGAQNVLTVDGTTPWGGTVITDSDISGGIRVNPGGFVYQDYQILFDLSDRKIVLIPAAVPEPATGTLILAGIAAVAVFARQRSSGNS